MTDPSQTPVDLTASILAILQAVGAVLGALVTLSTVVAPFFPSWKKAESKLRPAMERLGGLVHTVEGIRLSLPFTRYVLKGKQPPTTLLIIGFITLCASHARGDGAHYPLYTPTPRLQYRALAIDVDGKLRVSGETVLLAAVDLPAADTKANPSEPTSTNEAPPPKKLPTIAEVAACTLSAIPGVVTDCVVGGNYKGPAVDSRVFWTILGGSVGNSILTVGGFIAAHYLPVSNDKTAP